jgi:hypothetical protein
MAYTLSGLFQSIHGLQVVEPATNKFTTAQPQEEHIVALLNTNTNTCTVNMPTTRQRHDGHRYRGTSKAVQREQVRLPEWAYLWCYCSKWSALLPPMIARERLTDISIKIS